MQCFAAGWSSSTATATPTTGSCRSRPSIRTSRSHAPERFREAFKTGWNGPIRDWPRYGRVDELPEECEELRANYYAVVALCDLLLGELLDYFDEHDLWKDTALVAHHRPRLPARRARLLGQEPDEPVRGDRRTSRCSSITRPRGEAGARRQALTQTIDLAATFLDLFGVEPPRRDAGPLAAAGAGGRTGELREGALFGYFGGAVNVTDGRYTYHRYPPDLRTQEIYQYTVMPTHIWSPFTPEELKGGLAGGAVRASPRACRCSRCR